MLNSKLTIKGKVAQSKISTISTHLCYLLVFLLLLLLCSVDAKANIFAVEFAKSPELTEVEIVARPISFKGQQMTKQEAGDAWCSEITDGFLDSATTGGDISDTRCYWQNENTVTLEWRFRSYWPDGQLRDDIVQRQSTIVATSIQSVPQCPPADNTSYDFARTVDGQLQCYDMLDILDRDSCPDSQSDGTYVLPQLGNTSQTLCQQRDDGSMCAYDLVEDYYVANYEANQGCYTAENPNLYDGDLNPDENSQQCHDIGGGTSACPENPDNVCPNGQCQSGCGTIAVDGSDPVFVCLSDDTDGDGIGDYADPDIDGDGIGNEQDLDDDGDGIDDPVYPDGGTVGVGGTQISIDLTETNALISAVKNAVDNASGNLGGKLDDVNGNLSGIGNDIADIKDEFISDFSESPSGRDCGNLCSVFADDDIAEIQNQTQQSEQRLTDLFNEIRAEASGMFAINTNSTGFESYTWDFSYASVEFSFSQFADIFALIGQIVLLLAAFYSIKTVLG